MHCKFSSYAIFFICLQNYNNNFVYTNILQEKSPENFQRGRGMGYLRKKSRTFMKREKGSEGKRPHFPLFITFPSQALPLGGLGGFIY